jgi:two-component system response regulator MprA
MTYACCKNGAMDVLVVDDDSGARTLIGRSLSYAGYNMRVAASGQQALDLLTIALPDALVLELDLPDIDGGEICRRLRRLDRCLPILVISRLDSVLDRIRGLDAGADSYMPKPFSADELVARLVALQRRLELRNGQVSRLTFAEIELDATRCAVRVADRFAELTKTEYALLAMFMASPGRVFSPSEIHDRVWGSKPPSAAALRVYIGYVHSKLRAVGARSLLHTVAGEGYFLREP